MLEAGFKAPGAGVAIRRSPRPASTTTYESVNTVRDERSIGRNEGLVNRKRCPFPERSGAPSLLMASATVDLASALSELLRLFPEAARAPRSRGDAVLRPIVADVPGDLHRARRAEVGELRPAAGSVSR